MQISYHQILAALAGKAFAYGAGSLFSLSKENEVKIPETEHEVCVWQLLSVQSKIMISELGCGVLDEAFSSQELDRRKWKILLAYFDCISHATS